MARYNMAGQHVDTKLPASGFVRAEVSTLRYHPVVFRTVTLVTDGRARVLVGCAARVEPARSGADTSPSSAHLIVNTCEMLINKRFQNGDGFA